MASALPVVSAGRWCARLRPYYTVRAASRLRRARRCAVPPACLIRERLRKPMRQLSCQHDPQRCYRRQSLDVCVAVQAASLATRTGLTPMLLQGRGLHAGLSMAERAA